MPAGVYAAAQQARSERLLPVEESSRAFVLSRRRGLTFGQALPPTPPDSTDALPLDVMQFL